MEFTSKTIDSLQYFKGKTCTIITNPINRNFDETRSREHFVVDIREINRECIWGTHPYNGTVSFFSMSQVISIQEEIVLDPVNNPIHRKMIEDYEKQTGKKVVSDVSPHLAPTMAKEETPSQEETAFVDIKRLTQLAKQTKEGFESKKRIESKKS